jgi:branched-chain amino acid transport system ATP-binding protein
VLELRDLTVRYGGTTAVSELDLEVAAGEIVGLIGPNGAGKSTVIAAIAGLVPLGSGAITFLGRPLAGLAPEQVARRGIALVLEGRHVFGTLTVRENLALGTLASHDRPRSRMRIGELLERFPLLGAAASRPAATLSGGEQQQLAIARALVTAPRLLILDEPSLGLAPLLVDQVFDLIDALRDDGATVLLSEQNARRTVVLADRTYVMRSSRIVFSGVRAELTGQPELAAAYLGF